MNIPLPPKKLSPELQEQLEQSNREKQRDFIRDMFKPEILEANDRKIAKAKSLFIDYQKHKEQCRGIKISSDDIDEEVKSLIDKKIDVNDYQSIARTYTRYMKAMRLINGRTPSVNTKKVLEDLELLNNVERLSMQVETSQHYRSSAQLQKEVQMYEFIILDFIGWVNGMASEEEEDDEGDEL